MKHTNDPESLERFRGLQVLYVEDLLNSREKSEFEEHVRSCPRCTREIEDLKSWYTRLTTDKDVFCPEPWELYEHIRRDDGSKGHVTSHGESCPLCGEVVGALRSSPAETRVPDELWAKMEPLLPQRVPARSSTRLALWLDGFLQMAADTFRSPALAFGTVAAVALLVVITYTHLYRPGIPDLIPMLSSTPWGLGLNMMGEARPRLAVVPFFRTSGKAPNQAQVDGLFRAMSPPKEATERFEIIEPAQLKAEAAAGTVRLADRSDMLKDLASNLEVSLVALLTISQTADGFTIEAQLIDAETGKVRRAETSRTATGQLGSGLRGVLTSLLSEHNPRASDPAPR
ncbi:MAG: zf-HC2 domain-containing protein [Pseudomonadota bacterium]